jgi:DNA-binding GntR family transcriptional regulator
MRSGIRYSPLEPGTFEQIPQRTIDEEVLGSVRRAIVSGRLAPGRALNQSEIAGQMGISRIPLREALRKLEQEGLIVTRANRAWHVVSFTDGDVNEVFSLRSGLESMAFRWSVPRMEPQDIQHLHDLIDRQSEAINRQAHDELAALDMSFHEYICIKADHSRLLKAWYEQHAQCQMLLNLRFRHMPDYTPGTVIADHLGILKAIEQGYVQKAIDLTHEISQRVAQECVETLHALLGDTTEG